MNSKKESPIFYPFLFAIFPPIYLFAFNFEEVPLKHVILPVLIPLLVTALLWLFLSKTLLSKDKRGFYILLLMILFYYFGDLFDLFKLILSGYDFDSFKQFHLLIPLLGIFGWIFHLIKKSKWNYKFITKILNISISALVAFNMIQILFFSVKDYYATKNFERSMAQTFEEIDFKGLKSRPDIYYIILDAFASDISMKEIFNHDNTAFSDSLRERGFLISNNSRTRYIITHKCLATVLNMEYWTPDRNPFQMMRYNKVVYHLKKIGYQIINLPHRYQVRLALNDKVYYYKPEMHSVINIDYYMLVLEKSILRFYYDYLINSSDFTHVFRESILYDLDKLSNIPESQKPQFIYAHINGPHEPYVFDENGGFVHRENYFNLRDKIYYLGQYKYLSKRILEVIDTIQEKSEKKAVIILQSDHGIRPNASGAIQLDVGDHWQRIFNGMFLPDVQVNRIDDAFAPVNTFRFIFNLYFNQSFPMLPK